MTQLLFPGIKAAGSLLQHRIPSRQTTNRTRYQTQKSYNRPTKQNLEFCQVCQPTLSIFNFLIFSRRILGVRGENPSKTTTATPPASHPKPWGAPRSGDEDAWCRGIDCTCINMFTYVYTCGKLPQQTAPEKCAVFKHIPSSPNYGIKFCVE